MSLFTNTLLYLILVYLIVEPKLEFKFDLFRAFISNLLKNLAFSTSKYYFIYFNMSLNNTPYISSHIYTTH